MRILRVHNRYLQPGGEDVSFAAEVDLLKAHGHDVETLVVTNASLPSDRTPVTSARLAASTVWSRTGRALVGQAVAAHRPDVVHFDNTFPIISPAAYAVARERGAAVVQTLHNYRLLCPAGTLFRTDGPCHDCIGKHPPIPGIVHACYHDSRRETAAIAAMLTAHRLRRTWTRDVDRYIVLTAFARSLFATGGIPADRMVVKPNFVDAAPRAAAAERRNTFLFIGRLSPEKGIETLIAAAARLPSGFELVIAGDGKLKSSVETARAAHPAIRTLGQLAHADAIAAMRHARALVLPSTWYEGCPMTLIEAFAAGLPVIASRLGSMTEMIDDGQNGLLFEPGDPADLARKLSWIAEHPTETQRMGGHARSTYEALYTPEHNYEALMRIYRDAIGCARDTHRRPRLRASLGGSRHEEPEMPVDRTGA